jgi:hypothetical protein
MRTLEVSGTEATATPGDRHRRIATTVRHMDSHAESERSAHMCLLKGGLD